MFFSSVPRRPGLHKMNHFVWIIYTEFFSYFSHPFQCCAHLAIVSALHGERISRLDANICVRSFSVGCAADRITSEQSRYSYSRHSEIYVKQNLAFMSRIYNIYAMPFVVLAVVSIAKLLALLSAVNKFLFEFCCDSEIKFSLRCRTTKFCCRNFNFSFPLFRFIFFFVNWFYCWYLIRCWQWLLVTGYQIFIHFSYLLFTDVYLN